MATTAGGPRVLLEREDLLAHIDDALEGAREDRGRLVVVEGPAGIGKSGADPPIAHAGRGAGLRVLARARRRVEREFAFGVVGSCSSRRWRRRKRAERDALLAGAARRPSSASARWRAAPTQPRSRPRSTTSFAVLHGLYWLTANLAEHSPLLIALDDAHWADAPRCAS